MQVQSVTDPYAATTTPATNASSSSSASTASTNAAIASSDALGNENTFLQLLVAQIQNQDPTQPVDSSTFLTQLAQFSSLEQLIGIRQDLTTTPPATGTTATDPTTGTPATS